MMLDPEPLNPWRVAVLRRLAWPIIAFGVLVILGGGAVLGRYVLWLMEGFDPGFHLVFSGLAPLGMGAFVTFLGFRMRRLQPNDPGLFVSRDSISQKQTILLRAYPKTG